MVIMSIINALLLFCVIISVSSFIIENILYTVLINIGVVVLIIFLGILAKITNSNKDLYEKNILLSENLQSKNSCLMDAMNSLETAIIVVSEKNEV